MSILEKYSAAIKNKDEAVMNGYEDVLMFFSVLKETMKVFLL